MKQFMPVMRLMSLLFFCVATFVLSFGALLMKEGRLFPKKGTDAKESAAAHKGEAGGPASGSTQRGDGTAVKASLDGAGGDSRPTTGKPVDPAAREQALATGRALFDVAQPISISEASDLMVELTRTRQAFEDRRAALDLREKELNQFSAELEQKRSAILKLAGDAQASGAGSAAAKPEVLDKKTLTQIGNIFSRMQPQAAAHALASYPSDRAAQILMNMKDQSVAEILSFVSAADLVKLTDAIGKVKGGSDEE